MNLLSYKCFAGVCMIIDNSPLSTETLENFYAPNFSKSQSRLHIAICPIFCIIGRKDIEHMLPYLPLSN